MPKTLPGFLMLAGLTLLVLSFLRSGVATKWVTLSFDSKSRWAFRILGVLLIVASAAIYVKTPVERLPQMEVPVERTPDNVPG